MKLTTSASSAEIKNAWRYTSTPPYVFMMWYLFKHRDNFTFDFTCGLEKGQTQVPNYVLILCNFLRKRNEHKRSWLVYADSRSSLGVLSWTGLPCGVGFVGVNSQKPSEREGRRRKKLFLRMSSVMSMLIPYALTLNRYQSV
jgi:hypothetical protein